MKKRKLIKAASWNAPKQKGERLRDKLSPQKVEPITLSDQTEFQKERASTKREELKASTRRAVANARVGRAMGRIGGKLARNSS